ncbi:putative leucine-rich repeat-containing protein DDB_G0290503 isoform X2 [Prorops nasuta]|uniref:putative leucine-rich repeat-containing protein DDB_G0290503 isoform X2 n=1 Tax=Prorops nasuta TaxID=863751 RepID=UPI0034CE2B09
MEAPGLSLFQGSDAIQLNADVQRLEEEEQQEYFQRTNKELGDMITNAFDDLDNDDTCSVDSSHCQDGENDRTNTIYSTHKTNNSGRTVSQYQKEYCGFDNVDSSRDFEQNAMTNLKLSSEAGPTVSDLQREFLGPPSTGFNRALQTADDEAYVFDGSYPYSCETPANHYDVQRENYQTNGYIDRFENNIQHKHNHEFGGGDNITSDHYNHCYNTSSNGRVDDNNTAYKTANYESKEQLEVLYMVKLREIERLTDELKQLQTEKEEEASQLNRKVALLQAEVERSNISRNQSHHALVDAKAEIVDLQSQVSSLEEKIAVLEKTNQNMKEELSVSRDSVIDLQQKIAVLERVQSLQANDKTQEKFLKQAQEKHAVELRNMQTQINALTEKLNSKEDANTALEHKLDDVRRAHENLLVEKGDAMNRLAQALRESQEQCHNLMSNNNTQQVIQLQAQVKHLAQEKEDMHKTLLDFQSKLEMARNDVAQYDSLLATSVEDESDSIRQLKLGHSLNKSKSKPTDDITNKLRGELQRGLAAQALKRKEINRLENTLAQKEKELEKALSTASTCQKEAARNAKRVNELEQELRSVLTDQALKANAKIQKLSDHLDDVKQQCERLKEEKLELEKKLEEALAINQEIYKKNEELSQEEKVVLDEYNKNYLEIHNKAVERVRQEAQVEIVQLSVQLEQTQKELNRVKEQYINVYTSKEELIKEHANEIIVLKENYSQFDEQRLGLEKLQRDLQAQMKITEKLSQECEMFRNKAMELEKDLSRERKKKEEHSKKIHEEIEKAKQKAIQELRDARPNQGISVRFPDHCSEHSEKITQLEEDCKRLEEKLQVAVEEQKKMLEYQNQLDDAKLKLAQMEISLELWKKNYKNCCSEKSELVSKVSKLDSELSSLKKNMKLQDSDDAKIAQIQMENDTLREKYDSVLKTKNIYKDKISQLQTECSGLQKIVKDLESKLKRGEEYTLNSNNGLESELIKYKEVVSQLTNKLTNMRDDRKSDSTLEQKIKQLERDLELKEEQLKKLNELDKVKEERDKLIVKLKSQAQLFEQYVKNQKQVSAELNLSPRSSHEGTDYQKMREMVIKEVKEEMEQKVVNMLKGIEEHNHMKRNELEEEYKSRIVELRSKCNTYKLREKCYNQMIEDKRKDYHEEFLEQKEKVDQLQEQLKQKEIDVEEERNDMAQLMTKWVAEVHVAEGKISELNTEIDKLKENESKQLEEIKKLKNDISVLKHKYQMIKKTANEHKERVQKQDQFYRAECKRIEDGYKKSMSHMKQNLDMIVNTHEEQVLIKMKELENEYMAQIEEARQKLKYKRKC